MCFILQAFGVEGSALSGNSIHSIKSQSVTATAAANTRKHSHTALLLSTKVNTHVTYQHTFALPCMLIDKVFPSVILGDKNVLFFTI